MARSIRRPSLILKVTMRMGAVVDVSGMRGAYAAENAGVLGSSRLVACAQAAIAAAVPRVEQ